MMAPLIQKNISDETKTVKKKPKITEPLIVRRSSRRAKGASPDSKGRVDTLKTYVSKIQKKPKPMPIINETGCQWSSELYIGDAPEGDFIKTIKGVTNSEEGVNKGELDVSALKDQTSKMKLKKKNIAKVLSGRSLELKIIPCVDRTIVVTANSSGDLGFWDADCKSDHGGVYVYHPHTGNISGISVQPIDISKIFTSCKDGFIRMMDVEKEEFGVICSIDDPIFSLTQRPRTLRSLYFGVGGGLLNVWDERAGKCTNSLSLHERRINTINFNSEDTNLLATGSSDGTACIWDLRSVNVDKPNPLMRASRGRSVHSAYFSPRGSSLLTTSIDTKVGLMNGVLSACELKIIAQNEQMIVFAGLQVKAEDLSAAIDISSSENKVGQQRVTDILDLSEIFDSEDEKKYKPPTSCYYKAI